MHFNTALTVHLATGPQTHRSTLPDLALFAVKSTHAVAVVGHFEAHVVSSQFQPLQVARALFLVAYFDRGENAIIVVCVHHVFVAAVLHC